MTSAEGRRTPLKRYAAVIAPITAAFILLTFFGDLHRSIDTLSMLRPFAALILLISLFAVGRPLQKIAFAFIGLYAMFTCVAPFLPFTSPHPADIRVYSKNLWAATPDDDAMSNDILAARVDVVMLQEVSNDHRDLLASLRAQFPHQHLCQFENQLDIAVLSRTPFIGTPVCTESRALAAAQIEINDKPVWIVSAHIPWPWPRDAAANEEAALELLASFTDPIVMAGDFNAPPWSTRMDKLRRVSGFTLAGPSTATLWLKGFPLSIDHAMAPRGGVLERRPRFGSDHAGIVADLSL